MGYSPVYSTPFIQYTAETPNASFLVPEGYTAIIRQWSCAQDIGGWEFYLAMRDSDAAPALTIALAYQAGEVNYQSGSGRWVLNAGGTVFCGVTSLGTTPSFYVGGYLLQNVIA